MKKLLLAIIGLFAAMAVFASCNQNAEVDIVQDTEEQSTSEPTEIAIPTYQPTKEPHSSPVPSPKIVGEIVGDVLYRGMTISSVFSGNPEDVLGAPLSISDYEPWYFYDGLEVHYDDDYVEMLSFIDLSLFELDGNTLDMSREELISILGEPIEYYEYSNYPGYPYQYSEDEQNIRYHVLNGVVDYYLEFWFDDLTGKAYMCGAYRINP